MHVAGASISIERSKKEIHMFISPCIEWIFGDEHESMADRVRAVKAAGLNHAEFHLWRDKDVDGVAEALAETGVTLTGICVDPRRSLVDPAQHDELLDAVRDSLVAAKKLGSPPMILASGFTREGVSEQEHFDAAVTVLKQAAALAEGAGVMLMLEPLNDRVDHPGMYLVSNARGLNIVEAVGSPNLKLIYDLYHSTVMGEDTEAILAGRMHLVHHIQIADMPGRAEPGTGAIDWTALIATFKRLGYTGNIGLEYRPSMPAVQSIAKARAVLGL
jgi:hydroxypyruvate isomerase